MTDIINIKNINDVRNIYVKNILRNDCDSIYDELNEFCLKGEWCKEIFEEDEKALNLINSIKENNLIKEIKNVENLNIQLYNDNKQIETKNIFGMYNLIVINKPINISMLIEKILKIGLK